MKITKNTVVTVLYKLSDAQNNLLEEGQEPMVYLHGGYEDTLPSIEEALEGKEVGYTTMVQVEPEEAFGDYDPQLVKIEKRDKFPPQLEVGMHFEGITGNEEEDAVVFIVTDIADDTVVLDGNHPLAGMALRFSLQVAEVRAATPEEIERQYAGSYDDDDDDDDDDVLDSDQYRSIIIH